MKTLLSILLLVPCVALAQNEPGSPAKNYLSIELDPAPFILGGYSFSLKFSPKSMPHWTVMGSVYSSNFPDKMMSKPNYDNGFRELSIDRSYAFFADYFIRSDRSGLHFGPSVFLYSKSVHSIESQEAAKFNSIYPNVRLGYMYKPFRKSGFYVNPWLNFGKEFTTDEKPSIEGQEFLIEDVSYIVAIHLGYQITF